MFYELSNKNRMECERYQDCSWFQQDLTRESFTSKLLLAETYEPIIDVDEFDLAMPYAKESNILKGQKYPEVLEDTLLEKKEKEEDKIKNNISADDNLLFTNYKVEDEDIFNTCNVNYSIRKTDSFDNVENISFTNPAEILPITLMECLNSSKCGQPLNNIKNEPKEETELYSPGSNSYLMHSNDSDLNIGREEVIEEIDLCESTNEINTNCQSLSEKDQSCFIEASCKSMKSNLTPKILNSEILNTNISNCLSDILGENSNLSQPVKTEIKFSNNLSISKDDLNLDLPKVNFEQPINVSTPDLDFMDLVEYINEDININREDKTTNHSSLNSTNDQLILGNKSSIKNNVNKITDSNSVHHINNKNIRTFPNENCGFEIDDKAIKASKCTPSKLEENNPKGTESKVDEENISIAERIKTVAKRKSAKKYDIKHSTSSDEDDENYDTNDDNDEDEDYDYHEESPKRRCTTLSKKLKSDITELGNSLRKSRDESETLDSYRERRDKNNEASRRSRQNRKARERDMFNTLAEEERRNLKLRTESDVLEKQVTSLRQLLLQVVLKKAEAT